ncbi:hypothetical protein EXIGLDRAFT_691108 [Exidia glandulosa HHB12029]|uniref:Uncharacterized protein n=1 Tax=Exidia glandulosa HHB12029 TaxID=1314781 RepID=A0A165IV85_EXIGL|nr:hypothetical protein EXIGLDRAFT_691108 [Exidia glandulosa HHB12029]
MFSLNLLQFVKAALFLATGYFSGRALVRAQDPAPAPAPFAGFNNADLDTLVGQPVEFILDAVLGPGHNALTGPPPRRNAPLRRTDSTVDVCEDGGNGQWYSLVHRRMQPYPFYRTAKDIRDSRRRQAREAQARAAAAAAYAANPPVATGPLYAGVYTPPIGRDIIANAPPGTYPPPVIPHFPVFNTAVPNTPPATGRRFASPSSLETNPPSTARYSLNSNKRKRQAEDEVNGEDEAEAHLSEKAKGKRRRIETDSGAGSAANEEVAGASEQPVAGPSRAAGSHEQTVQPTSSAAIGATQSIPTTAAAGPSDMIVDDAEQSGSSSSATTAAPVKARRTTRKAAAAQAAWTSTGPTRTLRSSTRNAPYSSASVAAASTSTSAAASGSAPSPRRSTRSRKGKGKATEADNMDVDES